MKRRVHSPMGRRREPASEEGATIVRSILQATSHLLQRETLSALSTNRIARAAGVSIGSFYQYFANKEGVIAQLARSLDQRALELLQERAEEITAAGTREAVSQLVSILFDARMGSLALRRQLLQQVPRDWIADESSRVDTAAKAFVCDFLRVRGHEVEVSCPELATFVLFHSVESVVEAAVANHAMAIENDSLRTELIKLSLRYLGL